MNATNTTYYEIGDRVRVRSNEILGNLIGTIKAIHPRPKYEVYDVELDGGGTDTLHDFQIERIDDTKDWVMWVENKLSIRERILILLGWKIYSRFDAPTGKCSGACDMRYQITLKKFSDVRW